MRGYHFPIIRLQCVEVRGDDPEIVTAVEASIEFELLRAPT